MIFTLYVDTQKYQLLSNLLVLRFMCFRNQLAILLTSLVVRNELKIKSPPQKYSEEIYLICVTLTGLEPVIERPLLMKIRTSNILPIPAIKEF